MSTSCRIANNLHPLHCWTCMYSFAEEAVSVYFHRLGSVCLHFYPVSEWLGHKQICLQRQSIIYKYSKPSPLDRPYHLWFLSATQRNDGVSVEFLPHSLVGNFCLTFGSMKCVCYERRKSQQSWVSTYCKYAFHWWKLPSRQCLRVQVIVAHL